MWRETLERGLLWNMAVVHVCGHLVVSGVGYFFGKKRAKKGQARGVAHVSTSRKECGAVIPVTASV